MTESLRIVYVTPGIGPCGGIRVLIEHVNRLAARGHVAVLAAPSTTRPNWIDLEVPIAPFSFFFDVKPFDIVVATGFQTVDIALRIPAKRRFYFVQMMEHEFLKENTKAYTTARLTYPAARASRFQFITIADWLHDTMKREWNIDSTIIPNGVNKDHFYPDGDKQHAILVEGDGRNQAKDIEGISWKVAYQLREEFDVKLWGFSAIPNPRASEFDRYVEAPTTQQMREMYSQALFLLKASRYEGRACAPVEAMACGTTSVVAIIEGSDDLIDGKNCLRVGYDHDELLAAGRRLLRSRSTPHRLVAAALAHTNEAGKSLLSGSGKPLIWKLTAKSLAYADEHLNWDPIIDQLEKIYAP